MVVELVVHIVGVEQRQQRVGLGVEVAGGVRRGQQHPHVAAQDGGRRAVAGPRVAVGRRQQRVVGVGEAQPLPAEGHQPFQRRRVGPSGGGPNRNACWMARSSSSSSTIIRPARLPNRRNKVPFADAGGRGDVVHRDGVGPALGDEAASRVQQECAIAGGVAAFRRGNPRIAEPQLTPLLDTAHSCTLTLPE